MKIIDIAFKDLTRFFDSPAMPAIKAGVVNLDALPAGSPLGDNIRSMFFEERSCPDGDELLRLLPDAI